MIPTMSRPWAGVWDSNLLVNALRQLLFWQLSKKRGERSRIRSEKKKKILTLRHSDFLSPSFSQSIQRRF